jgi:hypothetical protein
MDHRVASEYLVIEVKGKFELEEKLNEVAESGYKIYQILMSTNGGAYYYTLILERIPETTVRPRGFLAPR